MKTGRQARSRGAAFRHAFRGLGHAMRTQPNARIHAAATATVVLAGLGLKIGRLDWALLLACMGLVWIAELFNTALEALVDLSSPDVHPLARVAKDVGAGAVFLAAAVATAIGLLTLGPPLWALIAGG